ncbi:MAG: rRNA pseudouridine synthase [Deltaproteobacteria bacterium]|nr:rRNA pseudouridine synthase [Deltaproteobacteria bacterium]
MKLIRHITQSTGLGRREVMEAIRSGRVRVNGREEPSASLEVEPGRDRVHMDGKLVRNLPPLHLVLYKPRATVCTKSDPEGRGTVYDLLRARHKRAASVGRLDFHTTGVLLLTTDGELARRLTLPRYGVSRTYRVRLRGRVTEAVLEKWRRGVHVRGRPTRPALIRRLRDAPSGALVMVTLKEGRNRQIHDMARATGLVVQKIHRMRFATIALTGLQPGRYRELTRAEVRRLGKMVRLEERPARKR